MNRAIGYIVEIDPRSSVRADDHRVVYTMSLCSDDGRKVNILPDEKKAVYY